MRKDEPAAAISIRPITEKDVPTVAAIERACFSHPWSENAILSELSAPGACFIAAFIGDTLCGYVSCRVVLDEAYMGNLAVVPAYRRRGIAEALLLSLTARVKAAGCAFLTLEVRLSNAAAITLYEKLGFRRVGARRRFYSAPTEDAAMYTIYFDERDL